MSSLVSHRLVTATLAISAALISASSQVARSGVPRKPNIVLILADDLGASDLGCYGADLHETPNLDNLAKHGVRFTQAYSPSPVCTPTRAAILTGKAPARLQMTIWSEGSLKGPTDRKLLQARSRHDLPLGEITLAEILQKAGYLTALVGKWHLGDANHAPETQGFDINIGGTHWGAPQTFFWPYRGVGRFGDEFRYVPHLEFGRPGEYLTDRLTDEALRVIDHASTTKQPFFLYLSHHAPHTPVEAKPADVTQFQAKLREGLHHKNPTYAAMVKSLDESVGRVLSRLKEHGLDRDTLVVFASDNGGYIGSSMYEGRRIPITDNTPLRSGKGTLYEGGVRVPLIVAGPGVSPVGRDCSEPVLLTDLFATLLTTVGLPTPQGTPSDGLDLTGLLRDSATKLGRDVLYFHYPHYYHAPPSTPVGSIRTGDWKLLSFFEDGRAELYNLRDDPSERNDVAARFPERVAELQTRLKAWQKEVGAASPTPNRGFRPSKS